jgi:peptidoglycan/xylan/chitin deacetylase (PgdA/CDA1 family)
MRSLLLAALLSGCAAPHAPSDEFFAWDDRTVLCSEPVDDLTGVQRDWDVEEGRFRDAATHRWVTMAHAHIPGTTVSRVTLEQIFDWADADGLAYVRFDELVNGAPPRAGLAFAFDDDAVAAWMSVRDLLLAHHARVTFFVTRWFELTDAEKADLATLAADGHDIEAHTVHHDDAVAYVAAHGLDAYIADEVVPSIQVLEAAGYHVTSFAYPFGSHDEQIDAAVLAHVARVRTTPGECPGDDTAAGDPTPTE